MSPTNKFSRACLTGLVTAFVMFPGSTLSADNLTFTGSLSIPNCVINNNNNVEVDFGDIEIQTMPAPNYIYHSRTFDVQISCPYNLGTPKLIITSSSAVSGGAIGAIKTSKFQEGGLMVYLRNKSGTNALRLDSVLDISDSITSINATQKTLTLWTALGRSSTVSTDLTPGPFTASANMILKYE